MFVWQTYLFDIPKHFQLSVYHKWHNCFSKWTDSVVLHANSMPAFQDTKLLIQGMTLAQGA
jgi:hypothetical protein